VALAGLGALAYVSTSGSPGDLRLRPMPSWNATPLPLTRALFLSPAVLLPVLLTLVLPLPLPLNPNPHCLLSRPWVPGVPQVKWAEHHTFQLPMPLAPGDPAAPSTEPLATPGVPGAHHYEVTVGQLTPGPLGRIGASAEGRSSFAGVPVLESAVCRWGAGVARPMRQCCVAQAPGFEVTGVGAAERNGEGQWRRQGLTQRRMAVRESHA